MKATTAAAMLVEKTAEIVLGNTLILMVPHAVEEVLGHPNTRHLSAARLTRYELALLTPSNIVIKRCDVLNPATLLPIRPTPVEWVHDCCHTTEAYYELPVTVQDFALENPELELWLDGSRYYTEKGSPVTGLAVVSQKKAIFQRALPNHCSAQVAELEALIKACELAEGKSVNIYTDSRYARGAKHNFSILWKSCNFLTSQGKLIKNSAQVKALLEAITLPAAVAVVKAKAHTKASNAVAMGNQRADEVAKVAALLPLVVSDDERVFPKRDTDTQTLQQLQSTASREVINKWKKNNCHYNEDIGIWLHEDGRPCAPPSMYPSLCSMAHIPSHVAKGGMVDLIWKLWYAPGVEEVAKQYCQACLICAQYNPGKRVKTPQGHIPRALYPFQRFR